MSKKTVVSKKNTASNVATTKETLNEKDATTMKKTTTVKNIVKNEVNLRGVESVETRFHVKDIVDLFELEQNVRDTDPLYGYALTDFAIDLAKDGEVREYVTVAAVKGVNPISFKKMSEAEQLKSLWLAMQGWRRVHASFELYKNPKKYLHAESFKYDIPVKVYFGLNEDQVLDFRLDHSNQKGLSEHELMKCVDSLAHGEVNYLGHEITWKLRNLFANSVSAVNEAKYRSIIAEVDQKIADGELGAEAGLTEKQKRVHALFKGRYQDLLRLSETPHEILRTEFIEQNVKGNRKNRPFKFTTTRLRKAFKLDAEEFDALVQEWKKEEKSASKPRANRTAPISAKELEKRLKSYKESYRLGRIIESILGDKDAQEEVRDLIKPEMILEEKARKADPKKFEKICRELAG